MLTYNVEYTGSLDALFELDTLLDQEVADADGSNKHAHYAQNHP